MRSLGFKYVILGAGPSGLSFAHTLLDRGEKSFIVLEKEAEAGGLCRSRQIDGAPLDIGGGHFLDVRRQEVLDLLFRFMPESEWARFDRIAKIRLAGIEVDHPLEGNLWQLPAEIQVDFLESIANAGCVRGEPCPKTFEAWIRWKLGKRIAEDYLIPYNRKIWSLDLNLLGTHWLHKLPDVSLRESLASCILRASRGKLPAHGQFLYPRHTGYGEVWRRMGEALGERLILNTPVESLDLGARVINGKFRAEHIVSTLPWPLWRTFSDLPREVDDAVAQLVSVPIDVDYVDDSAVSSAHWIYEPDERLTYHRTLCRSNFVPKARGCWTETNSTRSPSPAGFRHRNEFAYPVDILTQPALIQSILRWAESFSIIPIGRWGTWQHINSDVAVAQAIAAAQSTLGLTT